MSSLLPLIATACILWVAFAKPSNDIACVVSDCSGKPYIKHGFSYCSSIFADKCVTLAGHYGESIGGWADHETKTERCRSSIDKQSNVIVTCTCFESLCNDVDSEVYLNAN